MNIFVNILLDDRTIMFHQITKRKQYNYKIKNDVQLANHLSLKFKNEYKYESIAMIKFDIN